LALVTFGLPAALAADALPITGPYGEIEAKGCSAGNRRWLHRHRQ
jgi:hypothetical protein